MDQINFFTIYELTELYIKFIENNDRTPPVAGINKIPVMSGTDLIKIVKEYQEQSENKEIYFYLHHIYLDN